jgi:hypothetical protein
MKFLIKRGGIQGQLGSTFYPIDKVKITADCLENQFTTHNFCDWDHRLHMEATVQTLLATVGEDILLSSDYVTYRKKYNIWN